MTNKQRLMELIDTLPPHEGKSFEEALAEHLIANGVVVQKHGRWIPQEIRTVDTVFACSECDRKIEVRNDYFAKPTEHVARLHPYCHCGASMQPWTQKAREMP